VKLRHRAQTHVLTVPNAGISSGVCMLDSEDRARRRAIIFASCSNSECVARNHLFVRVSYEACVRKAGLEHNTVTRNQVSVFSVSQSRAISSSLQFGLGAIEQKSASHLSLEVVLKFGF